MELFVSECDRDGSKDDKHPVCAEGETVPDDCIGDDEEDGESEEGEEDDDDDDGGWITPSNIAQVKKSMGGVNCERATVPVGCLTTDFAMQVCCTQCLIEYMYQTVNIYCQYDFSSITGFLLIT